MDSSSFFKKQKGIFKGVVAWFQLLISTATFATSFCCGFPVSWYNGLQKGQLHYPVHHFIPLQLIPALVLRVNIYYFCLMEMFSLVKFSYL